jgi:apolipoprotein N-acyltransferase
VRLTEGAPQVVVRCTAALVLGVGLAAAMPPLSWWPLAFVAVGGLTLLCRRASLPQGALAGAVFGAGFVVACLWWLQVILPGAQVLVAVAQAPFFALLGLALAATARLPLSPLWGACCWVGAELLRASVPFGGLPWGRLGTAVVETPLVAWARVVGEGGLTLVVALVALLLAAAVAHAVGDAAREGTGDAGRRPGVAVACAAGAALLVAGSTLLPVGVQGGTGRQVTVAVVQGDVPGSGLDAFFAPRVTLRNHVAATRTLASDVAAGRVPRPDLVVWPENASDVDPLADPGARALVQRTVDDLGVPVLVGAVTEGPGPRHVQGSGIVWRPGAGPGQRYAKRRLVPFGEWVPFRAALTPLVPMLSEEIPRDFAPGDRPGVLDAGGVTVGAVMCFEVAFDAAVRDVAGGGVDLLAVQTNNAAYLGSTQLEQQWAITRLRAVETGRAVAVAATTGISGVIAPDGSVVARTHARSPRTIVAQVPAASGVTPGVRWGPWVEVVGSAVAAAGVAGSWLRRGRGTRRG